MNRLQEKESHNQCLFFINLRCFCGPDVLCKRISILMSTDTNQNEQSILRQEKFLNRLLERLTTEEATVLRELEEVGYFHSYYYLSFIPSFPDHSVCASSTVTGVSPTLNLMYVPSSTLTVKMLKISFFVVSSVSYFISHLIRTLVL